MRANLSDCAAELRRLAMKLETEWQGKRLQPAANRQADARARATLCHNVAAETGAVVRRLADAGGFPGCEDLAAIVADLAGYRPGTAGNNYAILQDAATRWVPAHCPGYVKPSGGLAYQFAGAMRAIAGHVASASEATPTAPPDNERLAPLAAIDEAILRALAAKHPVTVNQYDLSEAVERSRDTVGPALARLRQSGLTARPHGTKGGETITADGLDVLARMDRQAEDSAHIPH